MSVPAAVTFDVPGFTVRSSVVTARRTHDVPPLFDTARLTAAAPVASATITHDHGCVTAVNVDEDSTSLVPSHCTAGFPLSAATEAL